jgi:uncharacterized protein (TIGR01777 family)
MQLRVAGASGFLGQALSRSLAQQGHQVVRLVRSDTSASDEARWDPDHGEVDRELVEWADVVVNLAGASNVHFPWNDSYRRTFLESRTRTTRTLAEAIATSERQPAFLAQNGVAGYGDHGSTEIDESTPTDAPTFMGDVTRQWEAATQPASDAGARVVVMRTGVVLDKAGGALKQMLIPFRLGLGGPIGPGTQYFATISLDDWVGAATFLALNDATSGAYNLTGPDPSTNAEFTQELARALHRPAKLRVPGFAVRATGPIGGEVLASQRVEPRRLLDDGYAFAHNDITDRIKAALR